MQRTYENPQDGARVGAAWGVRKRSRHSCKMNNNNKSRPIDSSGLGGFEELVFDTPGFPLDCFGEADIDLLELLGTFFEHIGTHRKPICFKICPHVENH